MRRKSLIQLVDLNSREGRREAFSDFWLDFGRFIIACVLFILFGIGILLSQ